MEEEVSLAPKFGVVEKEVSLTLKFGVVEEVEVRYGLAACCHYL